MRQKLFEPGHRHYKQLQTTYRPISEIFHASKENAIFKLPLYHTLIRKHFNVPCSAIHLCQQSPHNPAKIRFPKTRGNVSANRDICTLSAPLKLNHLKPSKTKGPAPRFHRPCLHFIRIPARFETRVPSGQDFKWNSP